MTDEKDKTSLPLFLALTTVVIFSVAGGWFLLDQQEAMSITPTEVPEVLSQVVAGISDGDKSAIDLNAELRKARLAADADFLAYPTGQSALHFYGRVLAAEPDHAVAKAEFDAVLTRIAQQVAGQLATRNYDDAYRLASLVAKQEPDHRLVDETQQALNDYAGVLVEQAIQHAQDGNDESAEAVLATAAALPGRNSEYFSALRDSISEIQQSRMAAEQNKLQRDQQAAASARASWLAMFHGAIASGRLISPPGDSAIDYLATEDSPDDQKSQLTTELVNAIVASYEDNINSNRLSDAEALLYAAYDLAEDQDRMASLRNALETAFVEAEVRKVRTLEELVRLKTVPARYPKRAQERGISGWVEVMFTVTPTGETANIEILQGEPRAIFDAAAINAVEQWTFLPLEFRGQLISQRATTRFAFQLE